MTQRAKFTYKDKGEPDSYPALTERDGQYVTVQGEITDIDSESCPMYKVRFDDGLEAEVFGNELDMEPRVIPDTNEIKSFFHCGMCIDSLPPGMSPRGYVKVEVGFTPLGLQVWCVRHEANIVHIDFEGQQHPAVTTRQP